VRAGGLRVTKASRNSQDSNLSDKQMTTYKGQVQIANCKLSLKSDDLFQGERPGQTGSESGQTKAEGQAGVEMRYWLLRVDSRRRLDHCPVSTVT
jgi:hypothetical protein